MLAQHQTIEEADEDRMSGQEDTVTEEDQKKRRRQIGRSALGFWPFAAKLLEMAISVFCIGMIVEPVRKSTVGTRYVYQLLLIYSTYLGLLIMIAILLLGRLFGDRLPYKTNAIFSIVAAFLNLATGCQILIDRIEFSRKYIFYPHMYMLDMMCLSGVFAIINMFVYAIDAIFTIKLKRDL